MGNITISITHEEVIRELHNMISDTRSTYQDAALTIAAQILDGYKSVAPAYLVKLEF